jgi:hypothetical protein
MRRFNLAKHYEALRKTAIIMGFIVAILSTA